MVVRDLWKEKKLKDLAALESLSQSILFGPKVEDFINRRTFLALFDSIFQLSRVGQHVMDIAFIGTALKMMHQIIRIMAYFFGAFVTIQGE